MAAITQYLRSAVPFAIRVELSRLRRYPAWLVETAQIARARATATELAEHTHTLAEHASPLRRAGIARDETLQRGKERNVALAAASLDSIVIGADQVFSYHRLVGRPSRRRGFQDGLELRDGRLSRGVGGGCCQVSNLVYLLALRAGMNIVERHRHSLDLFPDDSRTVPFGCGATVFYNLADLRFANPLPFPVVLRIGIRDGHLVGSLRATRDPGYRVTVYERDHRFVREGARWIRENRIRRAISRIDGTLLIDHEVAHNRATACYEPSVANMSAAGTTTVVQHAEA